MEALRTQVGRGVYQANPKKCNPVLGAHDRSPDVVQRRWTLFVSRARRPMTVGMVSPSRSLQFQRGDHATGRHAGYGLPDRVNGNESSEHRVLRHQRGAEFHGRRCDHAVGGIAMKLGEFGGRDGDLR